MKKDPKEFQKERFEWSRWKHAILSAYLGRMAAILQDYGTIYFVDGFAGPGRYIEDGSEGSPLLAAKHAAKLEADNKVYSLRCINVEQDGQVFQNLQSSTASYSRYVTNFQGNFSDYIPQILQIIGESPTLFFLDPIGLKGLEWEYLLPIFQRDEAIEGKTELLLRYDVQRALRDTGFATSDWTHADANTKRLLDVFGVDTPAYWDRYLGHCGDSVPCRQDGITKAYEDKLRAHFKYVIRIPILRHDDMLKYYLIFATRSLKGVQVMNDKLHDVENIRDKVIELERRQQGIPKQLEMFGKSPDDELLDQLNRLKTLVLEVLSVGEKKRRDDLRAEVALKEGYFGVYSGTHFTAVLGGKPRTIATPKTFVPLSTDVIKLETISGQKATPSDEKTYIRRLK